MKLKTVAALAVISLATSMGLAVVGSTWPTPEPPGPPPGPLAWSDRRPASPLLAARLRDPASAVYRNQSVQFRGDDRIACGEVNARNGFGGMAGFSRFLVVDEAVFLEGDEDFEPVFRKYCVEPRARS